MGYPSINVKLGEVGWMYQNRMSMVLNVGDCYLFSRSFPPTSAVTLFMEQSTYWVLIKQSVTHSGFVLKGCFFPLHASCLATWS
jgi:hypothetical protein